MCRSPTETKSSKVRWRHLAEVIVGSLVLGLPITVGEEFWNLRPMLPLGRAIQIWYSSKIFI